MVCLDLTEMDRILIQYTSYLCRIIKDVEHVIFVHNIKFDYPEEANEIIDTLEKPLDEVLSEVIMEKMGSHFISHDRIKTQIHVEQNMSTPRALSELARTNQAELLIGGKKINYKGSGKVLDVLLRQTNFNASLLMVPETTHHQLERILIPTDFSKASKKALIYGNYLKQFSRANLECQHVMNIPAHYFPYIPVENVEEKMQKSAHKQWKNFVKGFGDELISELTCRFTFNKGKNTAQTIYDFALCEKKDLIIVSVKGKGALTSFLVGSVASRLIQLDMHIPLLVLK
jgi:nucleotide-binding universal stress UspA family protein